jgi:hypothetical protein
LHAWINHPQLTRIILKHDQKSHLGKDSNFKTTHCNPHAF